ncbi:hypothetical protein E4631_17800 [Hymenobacter sp. UV11]|uniref:hypothetical protein n=1 Tax=Hymenobacter sp. UV11 TaxID=1849735 RepID=UPI00105C279A|nr:hypothetical protein [Hymenobacter sp. UV11]TDN40162.1 hypothetical protein A8B98_14810 [Hymenobacter sp. UV11]TFZ64844.1 hypothetical protein E4631_17800 [Hymenobacter sp. UV11]
MKPKKILSLPAGWKVRVKLSTTGSYTVLLFKQQQVRMELMCQKASIAMAVWECIEWASRVQTDKKLLYPLG